MGTVVAPRITTRGLLVDLDASTPRSAVNGETGWKNLVDGGGVRTNTIFGSPDITTLGGVRTWRFTGTTQYFEANLLGANNQPYLDATVEAWIYPEDEVSAGDRGTIARINGNQSLYMGWNKTNRKLSTYWYSHATQADSTVYGAESTGQAVEIGMESSGRQFSGGICILRVYNVALTDEEVFGNYNAMKYRFGINV